MAKGIFFRRHGNVGLGKTKPAKTLDIAGDLNIDGNLTVGGSSIGALAMAAFGSTPNANGASVSGSTLTLQPADATHPGGLTTGTQTIGGAKTFDTAATFSAGLVSGSNTVVSSNVYAFPGSGTINLFSQATDGASAVAVRIGHGGTLGTTGAKLVSFCTAMLPGTDTEKAYIDKDGGFVASNGYGVGNSLGATQGIQGSGSNVQINAPTAGAVQIRHSNSGTALLTADPAGDGGTAVGITTNTTAAFSTSGAKLLSFKNNGTEKAFIDKDGNVEVTTVGSGFILKSPDGTRYLIKVANGGVLSTSAA